MFSALASQCLNISLVSSCRFMSYSGKIEVHCHFYLHLTDCLLAFGQHRLDIISAPVYQSLLLVSLLPPVTFEGGFLQDLLLRDLTSAGLFSFRHAFICLSHLFPWLQLLPPSFAGVQTLLAGELG